MLNIPPDFKYFGVHGDILTGSIKGSREQGAHTVIQGNVCESCNEGWMSDLETDTQALLPQVSRLESISLSAAQCTTLANWFYKTLTLYSVTTNYRRLVPDSVFHHLYDYRKPPPRVHVELATAPSAPEHTFHTRMCNISVVRYDRDRFEKESMVSILQQDSHVFSIQIGKMLARVVGWPAEGLWTRLDAPRDSTVRIYPAKHDMVQWPLEKAYEPMDQSLAHFTLSVGLTRLSL
jgi:hypothetical protein